MATSTRDQINDLTVCPHMDEVYRDPKTSKFQHSISRCEGFCREQILGSDVECTLCRKTLAGPSNGLRCLSKNFVWGEFEPVNLPLTNLGDNADPKGLRTSGSSLCDKHTNKTLDLFCLECMEAVCNNCLTNSHSSHKFAGVEEIADELRKTLTSGVTELEKSYKKCERSLKEIENEEREFVKHVRTIENEITNDVKRLQDIIERNKVELLAEVSAKKSERLKVVDNMKQEVRQQMAFVNSLKNYTTEVLKNGTACSVAREVNSLSKRVRKLVECDEVKTAGTKLGDSFCFAYTPSKAQETDVGNLVGSVSSIKVQYVCSLPEDKPIGGLTTLNKQLYVRCSSQDVAVYDTDTYSVERRISVPGLGIVSDMASCHRQQCLYIGDCKNNVVHRVDVNTSESRDTFTNWAVDDEPAGLSVSADCNVIVTCLRANKIKVFSTNGKPVKVIDLQKWDIFQPWHTIQLTAGTYVVCHGDHVDGVTDTIHRVVIVDVTTGKVHQSFGDGPGSGDIQLNVPARLAVVKGLIFVVDINNHRVLVLSSCLRYIRTFVSGLVGVPTRTLFDERNNRLYIDENKYDFDSGQWATGHVKVYSVGN